MTERRTDVTTEMNAVYAHKHRSSNAVYTAVQDCYVEGRAAARGWLPDTDAVNHVLSKVDECVCISER